MQALYEDASLEVLLSIFESLEATQYRRHIPGRSSEWQLSLLRNAYRIPGRIGFPVECAYDTITIGKKVVLRFPRFCGLGCDKGEDSHEQE
jgi:hypothetical protein